MQVCEKCQKQSDSCRTEAGRYWRKVTRTHLKNAAFHTKDRNLLIYWYQMFCFCVFSELKLLLKTREKTQKGVDK